MLNSFSHCLLSWHSSTDHPLQAWNRIAVKECSNINKLIIGYPVILPKEKLSHGGCWKTSGPTPVPTPVGLFHTPAVLSSSFTYTLSHSDSVTESRIQSNAKP